MSSSVFWNEVSLKLVSFTKLSLFRCGRWPLENDERKWKVSSGPCSSASLRDGSHSRTCSSSSDSDSLSGAYLKEGIASLHDTHLPQPVISCAVLRIPGNVERG